MKFILFTIISITITSAIFPQSIRISESEIQKNNYDVTKKMYYSVNTAGAYFFMNYDSSKSGFNITSTHGISRYLSESSSNAIGMGIGLNFYFGEKFNTTILYEPRLIYGFYSLFANLGYSFGIDELKGFAFESGVGVSPVNVAEKIKLNIDGGYGGKGDKSYWFLRGGIMLY